MILFVQQSQRVVTTMNCIVVVSCVCFSVSISVSVSAKQSQTMPRQSMFLCLFQMILSPNANTKNLWWVFDFVAHMLEPCRPSLQNVIQNHNRWERVKYRQWNLNSNIVEWNIQYHRNFLQQRRERERERERCHLNLLVRLNLIMRHVLSLSCVN